MQQWIWKGRWLIGVVAALTGALALHASFNAARAPRPHESDARVLLVAHADQSVPVSHIFGDDWDVICFDGTDRQHLHLLEQALHSAEFKKVFYGERALTNAGFVILGRNETLVRSYVLPKLHFAFTDGGERSACFRKHDLQISVTAERIAKSGNLVVRLK
jgi:hypothetical protein